MWLLLTIDRVVRGCVAVPLLLAGIALTQVSEVLIQTAAWVSKFDLGDEQE